MAQRGTNLDVSHSAASAGFASGRALLAYERMLQSAPPAARDALARRHREISGPERRFYAVPGGRVADSYNDADRQLRTDHAALVAAKVPIAFDDDEIEFRAMAAARHCRHASSDAAAIAFCESRGVSPPKGRNVTARSARRRLNEPRWWRRRYRAKLTRAAENAFRQVGLVHRHASPYVTDDGLARFAEGKRRSARFLAESDAVCVETGELFPLEAIAEKSVSNPAIRRGELMTRVRGFEEVASALSHVGLFCTLTAPSAFHAVRERGEVNPRWVGVATGHVRAAQAWLMKQWARARAKLARLSVSYYGIRVAEPHHDGTPHWHLLLFVARASVDAVRRVLRAVWLSEYADEPGAVDHRAKFIDIDPGKGTASGYIAKYVAKGVDGHALVGDDPEETSLSGADASARVVAWARIHGIRQFQQFGGPLVTLWRELRRLREPVEAPTIERARLAADTGDWRAFVGALGGIGVCRKAPPVELDKAFPKEADREGREVLRLTGYGELPEKRAIGVRCIELGRIRRERTRLYRWRQVRRSDTKKGAVPVMKARGWAAATGGTGADRPAASDSSLFLPLGPVAITVRSRACGCAECSTGQFAPYRVERPSCRAGP